MKTQTNMYVHTENKRHPRKALFPSLRKFTEYRNLFRTLN